MKTTKSTKRAKSPRAVEVESVVDQSFQEVVPDQDPIQELNEKIDALDKRTAPVREKLSKLERERQDLNDRLLQVQRERNIQRWEKLWGFLRGNPDLLDVLAPEHRSRLCSNDIYNSDEIGDELCPRCTLDRLGSEYRSDDLAYFVLKFSVENE
jgi:hypothetical protein